ncbi:uncharacterized protein LOC141851843 [Brevipalpus obovatus]|uniref:uncharacterized protein LOC141851843 n=1 Tax=Brevipalpus obovatus TaxID=246614 RepID=UPI003D9DD2A3
MVFTKMDTNQSVEDQSTLLEGLFRMFRAFLPGRHIESGKIIDYNLEKVLQDRGLLFGRLFGQSTTTIRPGSITLHYLSHFFTLLNMFRLFILCIVTDSNTIVLLGDASLAFGDSRISANVCLFLIYGSAYGTIFVFHRLNRNPSQRLWLRFYVDSHERSLWTVDQKKWKEIRMIINFMYAFNLVLFSYFFFPVITIVLLAPLIQNSDYINPIDRTCQFISCLTAEFAQFMVTPCIQLSFFLFNSYCLITQFRLECLLRTIEESKKDFLTESYTCQFMATYLSLYKEVKNANNSLSLIMGANYSGTFLLALFSIFIFIFSSANEEAKFVFGSLSVATIVVGVCGTCITGSVTSASVCGEEIEKEYHVKNIWM